MKSAGAIAFDVRPSRLLIVALLAAALLALASLWLSGLRDVPWIAACLTGAVLFAAIHRIRRLRGLRWKRAGVNADGAWTLLDATQTALSVDLVGWSALGLVLLLRLRSTAGESVTLYLTPDNLDRDTRRRLRVRLAQLGSVPASPTSR